MTRADDDRYPPIGDYAFLSDCHSAALVSRGGSVDWACLRRFDAASAFARVLDWERGGHFALTAVDVEEVSRAYVGDSLVLATTVRTATGRARVTDAFAMRPGGAERPYHQLLRVVDGLTGTVDFDVCLRPRFDYGELRPWLRLHPDADAFSAVGGDNALVIVAGCDLHLDEEAAQLTGRLRVTGGERRRFSLQAREPHDLQVRPCPDEEIDAHLDETLTWWRDWSAKSTVGGRYAEHVRRSATVLKGLTCAPTGAVVAAPTTSLPEELGGERNWDYRYSWIRDSTLVLAALEIVNHPEAAHGFRDFILRTTAGSAADMQIMYGPYGGRYLPELELSLEGYRGSAPVRIGNGAFDQTQHDMYGQVLDAASVWRAGHDELDPDEWRFLRRLVERAAEVWQEPDQGIWEIRSQPRHFVHSKVWLWAAMDRGVRLAEDIGADDVDVDRWREVRADIREAVDTRGVDPDRGNFVQYFGSTEVDAALLELPMVGFVAAGDERMLATVDVIREDLGEPPHGFLHRYRTEKGDDGLAGDEATFLMCSFWLVDVLAMQGRLDEAVELFERLLELANDVGLYSEQYDPGSGLLLGNFPQAFTHMALINSAHQIACARQGPEGCRRDPWSTVDRLTEREL